jgi:hypothetical protein
MKKILSIISAIVLLGSTNVFSQDLQEILDNYFEVTGLEKVLETNSMIAKGKAVQMGMEFPMSMYQKRPMKVRVEAEIQGMKMVQAFNGQDGWAIMPWTGSLEPQDMSPDQVKGMKQSADMEGDLYNWQEKGFMLTLEGEEEMEGTPAYKLKLEKPDGDVFTYFLDAEDYVILKVDAKVMVQGTPIETSSYYSNYKPVEGMIMPHSIETRMGGQVQMSLLIDGYEINPEIADSLFEKSGNSTE